MIKKRFSLQTDTQEICPWKSINDEVIPDINSHDRRQFQDQIKTEGKLLNFQFFKTEKIDHSTEQNKEINRKHSVAFGSKEIQKLRGLPLSKQSMRKTKIEILCETTKKTEQRPKKLISFKSYSINRPVDIFQEIALVKQFSIRVSNPQFQSVDHQFKNYSRQVNHNADRFFGNLNKKQQSQKILKNPLSKMMQQRHFSTSKLSEKQLKKGLCQILKVKPKIYESCRVIEKQMHRANSIKTNRNKQQKSPHVLDRILFNS